MRIDVRAVEGWPELTPEKLEDALWSAIQYHSHDVRLWEAIRAAMAADQVMAAILRGRLAHIRRAVRDTQYELEWTQCIEAVSPFLAPTRPKAEPAAPARQSTTSARRGRAARTVPTVEFTAAPTPPRRTKPR